MSTKHTALKEKYKKEVAGALAKDLDIKNVMAIPKITKVVVNMGTGERLRNKDTKGRLLSDFAAITGQAPKTQLARLSIAGFSLRAGMPVGLSSTLRGDRMYFFLDKLISVVLPRLRDFRGIPTKSVDQNGNYTLGMKDYTIFPEIDIAKAVNGQGLEITIVTNTNDKKEALMLLEKLGFPFEKADSK